MYQINYVLFEIIHIIIHQIYYIKKPFKCTVYCLYIILYYQIFTPNIQQDQYAMKRIWYVLDQIL